MTEVFGIVEIISISLVNFLVPYLGCRLPRVNFGYRQNAHVLRIAS